MKITYEKNGIRISRLFKSRKISYSDIKSVILSDMKYIFTTKAGEVIKNKSIFCCEQELLYEIIIRYNIYFKDENESKKNGQVYFGNELNEKIAQTQAMIKDFANNLIRNKLGDEYEIDSVVKDEGYWINVYFRLLRNGELVKDIPEEAKYDSADIEPYAFENFVLAFLVEWDGYGKYGVTKEMDDREKCEEYLKIPLEYLFEHYKK